MMALPLLTRIFDPIAFAVLGAFMSLIGIISAFSTGRMEWVIPNARSDSIAAGLLIFGATLLFAVTVTTTICLIAISFFPNIWSQASLTGWFIWLVPFSLLLSGGQALLNGWLVRTGQLDASAHSTIIQSALNAFISLITGLAGLGTSGLVIASVAASTAGIIIIAKAAGIRLYTRLKRISTGEVTIALRKHGKQAAWSTGVSVLNAFTISSPLFIIGALYSSTELGWYLLMHRLVAAPVGILSTALAQSFWSHAARLSLEGDMSKLGRVYRTVTLRLALAAIPVIAVCLAGPFFVGALLGEEEWSGAGYVLLAMTPLFVANLLFSPTNHLVVMNKQHLQLIVDALRLGLLSLGLIIGFFFELGFITAVFLSSAGAFIGYSTIYYIHIKEHTK